MPVAQVETAVDQVGEGVRIDGLEADVGFFGSLY